MLLVIMTVNSGRDDCAASDFGPPVYSGMFATWIGAGGWRVAMTRGLNLIERNKCDFWIRCIRFILNHLKNLRQQCYR